MLKTFTTSPLKYTFDNITADHVISVLNNATYDFSHDVMTHDGLIELSIPFYADYVPQQLQDGIFKNCADLSSVEGMKIKYVGAKTFMNCDSLRKVNLPEVTTIKSYAFLNCNLSTVVLSDATKVTQIEPNSFYNNYRRPVSVYIPAKLSSEWYDKQLNNNWQYLLSGLLSDMSSFFKFDVSVAVLVLSANNTEYTPEIKNIMISTDTQGRKTKEVWDALYPNVTTYMSLVNTLSILTYTPDGSYIYFTSNDKKNLNAALISCKNDYKSGKYMHLSDIIASTCVSSYEGYSAVSSDNVNAAYCSALNRITLFPVYLSDEIEKFEKFRPLSTSLGVMSSLVDMQTPIDNIYRKSKNTIVELLDIFEPLSIKANFISTHAEVSSTALSGKYYDILSTAISYYDEAFIQFNELIK